MRRLLTKDRRCFFGEHMKWLTLALMLAGSPVFAETGQIVIQGCSVVSTSTVVSVSSQTPTAMISDATKGYRALTVPNLDSTNYLLCSWSVDVSSLVVTNRGFRIGLNGADATFSLTPGNNFYCINDSATAAKNAWVGYCR